MTQARTDENQVLTMIGVSSVDGITPTLIYADPASNTLNADDASTGTDQSPDNIARRDHNGIPVLMAVSEVDGVTPVVLYVNPVTNKLLIDSN